MKKLLILVGVAVVLFASSAGVSYWLQKKKADAKKEKAEAPGKTESEERLSPRVPAIKPPFVAGSGKIITEITKLQQEDDRIKKEKKSLERRAKQFQLILADIAREQTELDVKRKEVKALLQKAKDSMEEMQKKAQTWEEGQKAKRAELEKLQNLLTKFDAKEMEAYRDQAEMFAKMDPELAAQQFSSLIRGQEVKPLAKILAMMNVSKAAKIIEKMQLDPTLDSLLLREVVEARKMLPRQ